MSGFFEATRGLMVWNPPSTARTLGLTTDVVRDFGASGSTAHFTGSMTAGSNTLTLASPGDFLNGQGIVVTGAGTNGALLVTTILGGAGTVNLTLAVSASATVTNALVQHDDSWAWQAAIDAATAPVVITCPPGSTMNIAATLILNSDVVLSFPTTMLVWTGPEGGCMFTSPASAPLLRSGLIGGRIDPGDVGQVINLHSPQDCAFDLMIRDGAPTMTVMRWAGDATGFGSASTTAASGNVVYGLLAGTCGTLLSLAGQSSGPVTGNTLISLDCDDCHVGGVVCESSGYVNTNLFLKTRLTLTADNSTGVDLGQSDQALGIANLIFLDLSIENPNGKNCTGLYLHGAAQVQMLSFTHTGFPPGSAVNIGQAVSYYIRDTGQGGSDVIQDTTKGWSVTPLQVGPNGTPITNHLSSFQLIQSVLVPPQSGSSTSANVTSARPGDTVIATPSGVMPLGVAWNALAISDGVVALYLTNSSQMAPIPVPPMQWRFDIWQH
jgi:hypothetical protein